jgi:glucose-6-phosphate isomerase
VHRNRFVLAGMGGSSLAPAVIAAAFDRELILLDSTHPRDIARVLDPDPSNTLFVLSSKSGTTIETLSHLKVIEERIARAELPLAEHLVVISDPGSPLLTWAKERKVRHFLGEVTVGGRFSALSIFGLLPATLLGVDCATLLDDAADMQIALSQPQTENIAMLLLQEILTRAPFLSLPASPLSDWIEQLVAESTGKDGVGIIPVLSYGGVSSDNSHKKDLASPILEQALSLPLGASFYLWEWTTALLGYALEVNPFDQPNVGSAKEATSTALSSRASFGDGVIRTSTDLIRTIEAKFVDNTGYLGILAYLPMHDKQLQEAMVSVRESLAGRFDSRQQQVTLGFGPRYLHSTGQCHKGGPAIGSFLIITMDSDDDYLIPHESFSFKELITAQALGDFQTLTKLGREVVHAHLTADEIGKLSQSLREAS